MHLHFSQAQKAELEEACRTKDEQSVMRETETQKQTAEITSLGGRIRHLETQLQEAEVYTMHNNGARESFSSIDSQKYAF